MIWETTIGVPQRRICPNCNCDPCMDGTGCIGNYAPRRVDISVTFGHAVMATAASAMTAAIETEKMTRDVDRYFRHPMVRGKETPRSPQRRFRKGR